MLNRTQASVSGLLFSGQEGLAGDFAAGQRTLPIPPTIGDFASGQRLLPDTVMANDYAGGQRTLPFMGLLGDFATGQRNAFLSAEIRYAA